MTSVAGISRKSSRKRRGKRRDARQTTCDRRRSGRIRGIGGQGRFRAAGRHEGLELHRRIDPGTGQKAILHAMDSPGRLDWRLWTDQPAARRGRRKCYGQYAEEGRRQEGAAASSAAAASLNSGRGQERSRSRPRAARRLSALSSSQEPCASAKGVRRSARDGRRA